MWRERSAVERRLALESAVRRLLCMHAHTCTPFGPHQNRTNLLSPFKSSHRANDANSANPQPPDDDDVVCNPSSSCFSRRDRRRVLRAVVLRCISARAIDVVLRCVLVFVGSNNLLLPTLFLLPQFLLSPDFPPRADAVWQHDRQRIIRRRALHRALGARRLWVLGRRALHRARRALHRALRARRLWILHAVGATLPLAPSRAPSRSQSVSNHRKRTRSVTPSASRERTRLTLFLSHLSEPGGCHRWQPRSEAS